MPSHRWGYKAIGGVDVPILIPFFHQKIEWIENGRWGNIFQNHWSDVFDPIVNSEGEVQFYFVGYGLPPADQYMMSWLLNIFLEVGIRKGQVKIISKGDPGNLSKVLSPFINPDKDIYECGLEHFLEGHAKV